MLSNKPFLTSLHILHPRSGIMAITIWFGRIHGSTLEATLFLLQYGNLSNLETMKKLMLSPFKPSTAT